MRVIKYRAWDNQRKAMMYDYQWIDSRDPAMGGGVIRQFKYLRNNRSEVRGQVASAYHEEMSYIGCSDKNGQEIYEGDLLQVAGNRIYEVVYILEDEHGEKIAAWGLKTIGFDYFGIDHWAIVEGKVIGNIHETPEKIPTISDNMPENLEL